MPIRINRPGLSLPPDPARVLLAELRTIVQDLRSLYTDCRQHLAHGHVEMMQLQHELSITRATLTSTSAKTVTRVDILIEKFRAKLAGDEDLAAYWHQKYEDTWIDEEKPVVTVALLQSVKTGYENASALFANMSHSVSPEVKTRVREHLQSMVEALAGEEELLVLKEAGVQIAMDRECGVGLRTCLALKRLFAYFNELLLDLEAALATLSERNLQRQGEFEHLQAEMSRFCAELYRRTQGSGRGRR